MPKQNQEEQGRLLYEIGTGAVRVEIVEDAYGFCEFRLVCHRYSIIAGETGTSDRFDLALINEAICRLQQTQLFLQQRSAGAHATTNTSKKG